MSLDTVEHTSQEIGSDDNESTMLIGCNDNNAENLADSQGEESKKMKEDAEEGELEEGELDDETEEPCDHSDQVSSEQSPNGAPVVQAPESESLLAKSEKRKERSDSERKTKGHSHHRSVPRTALFDGIADANKEDEGKETHGRSQRHGKRRERQRSKEDNEKKKTNYSTYIDFDDIQDDFESEDSWMHGSRSKKSRRSRDSMRGPYDSPGGSGDEDFEVDDEVQSSSRNYRSQYQYTGGNYGGFYEALQEEDDEDDDNEPMDQSSDYNGSKTHYMKQSSQDGGYKGSPSHYNRSKSSERKIRSQLPRKRKLVDTPMEERPACKFFKEGKCVKGTDCPFNHDFVPPKKEDVCRFYLNERGCTRENCVYYHADWPCRYYHKTGSCIYGDSCKFSHAELTEETKHLIYLESSDDHHMENWRSSSNSEFLDLSQSSEKKKIPSLLDLEIYPPGQEPKIPSPTFSSRAPYKRQRISGPMGGQPGLLGAGPQMSGGSGSHMSSRMRQMGCNSKGYYSSHGGDQFNMDDSSSSQFMHSPDNSTQGEGGDEEPYQSRSGDEEDQELMTSMTGGKDMAASGQSVEVSCLPPVQRDLYRRIQEHQQFPQNTLSQPSNNVQEKWYSSDEEGDGCDTRASEATLSTSVTPADIIQSLAGQTSQMQKPLLPDSVHVQSMPSMFGMPPPCGLMPRGMPPTREMLQPLDMMSQGPRPSQGILQRPEMMPPQRNMAPMPEIMSKGISLMLPQTMAPPPDMMPPRSMMPPSDMMGQAMMLSRSMMGQRMMPPRCMMPPSDMMGQGMMPPRVMMPPPDIMSQGMMPPRGVPPPTDMMPRGMMPQRGMVPSSDMMPQGMMPPQGVSAPSDMPMRGMMPLGLSQPDGMPPLFNMPPQSISPIDINHILSVIRNSTLQLPPNLLLPPATTSDMMTNPSSNFNQSHNPRTAGNMTDPRLPLNEPSPDVGMMPVSSFLQPPESPDQEIEINGAGKKVPYVLRPIIIDSQPGLPLSVNLENLQISSDPRLQKYLNLSQSNTKTRSSNEMDTSDNSVVPIKPTDPRLMKRGGSEAAKKGDVESGNDGSKGTKQQKPYTLPDIVLPVLPSPVQEKTSTPKTTDLTVSTRKTVLDDPAPRATSIPSPSIKPVDKTPQNLVELPEALQERSFPTDGRFSRQSSTGLVGPVSTNADRKLIDYRNDPRYKKKKTKPLLEDSAVLQPQISGKVKEGLCQTAASTTEEWASERNTKTKVTEPKAPDSSVSRSPFSGSFKMSRQEVAEAEQEVEGEAGESESFNPESQKSEAVSVHTPVTFFEGVPVSSILSDVEPTLELNLKDMFKTIDPTTSPFC